MIYLGDKQVGLNSPQDGGAVLYTEEQELTDIQKERARDNIAAVGSEEFGELKSQIGNVAKLTTNNKASTTDAINEIAAVVYEQEYTEQEAENIYPRRSEDAQLAIGETSFSAASSAYGFYLQVTDYRGKMLFVSRDIKGTRFRVVFCSNMPAVGVMYDAGYRTYNDNGRNILARVPSDANYLYIMYYSSSSDTITKEQAVQGFKIVEGIDENLFESASDDKQYTMNSETFQDGSTLYGLYARLPKYTKYIDITRDMEGERFRICFSADEPAIGIGHLQQINSDGAISKGFEVPDGVNYVYWGYYNPTVDTYSREQLREGMKIIPYVPVTIKTYVNHNRIEEVEGELAEKISINQGIENARKALVINEDGDVIPDDIQVDVDSTLSYAGKAADAKSVGDILYTPHTANLYSQRSQRIQLSFGGGVYNQATTLYGFYIPIDPAEGTTITIQRLNTGTRFRVAASADVPAIGVSYHGRVDRDSSGNTIEYSSILSTDRYLYIAYYSSNDTLTEDELLAGFKIFYGTKYTARENRVESLEYSRDVRFISGNIDTEGLYEEDSKHIVGDYIRVNGIFGLSCPEDYQMSVHLYDPDGSYITSSIFTDAVKYLAHFGTIRICISDAELADITPSTVDFSKVKMPYNRYSPKSYTSEKTTVLDAENSVCDDVYAYLDSIVAAHGMYATKAYLCTEESGLPIYYYTLGNGAKKLCLVSGQHGPGSGGDPRDSVITVAKLIHDLIDGDFPDSSFLRKIHDEYTVLVIPTLNAYGFNNRSRTNADGIDINRDWTNPSTIEVAAAKALIASFGPDIAFDVHCNGSTPIANVDVEIQYGLGETHNPLYKKAVQTYFKSYYNTDVAGRLPNSSDTLQYYIQNTLGIMGGLLELRWWMKDKKWMHDYQAESANYAMLLNAIKYCASINDAETYAFEHTPNQNQY